MPTASRRRGEIAPLRNDDDPDAEDDIEESDEIGALDNKPNGNDTPIRSHGHAEENIDGHDEEIVTGAASRNRETFPQLNPGSKYVTRYGVVEVIRDDRLPPDYHKETIVVDKKADRDFTRRGHRFREREKLVVDQIAAGARHRREELKNIYMDYRSTGYMDAFMTQKKVWSLYCKSVMPDEILTRGSTWGCNGNNDELERKTKIDKFDPKEDPRFPSNYYPDRIVECKLLEANAPNHHKTFPMHLFIARRELARPYGGDFNGAGSAVRPHPSRCTTTKNGKKETKKKRVKAIEKKALSGSGHNLLQDFQGVKKAPSRSDPAPFGNPHRVKDFKKDTRPAWLVFNAQRSSMYPEIYASMGFKRGSQNRNHFIKIKETKEYTPKAEKSRLRKIIYKRRALAAAMHNMPGVSVNTVASKGAQLKHVEIESTATRAKEGTQTRQNTDPRAEGSKNEGDGAHDEIKREGIPAILKVAGASETMPSQKKRRGHLPSKATQQNTKIRPTCHGDDLDAKGNAEKDNYPRADGKTIEGDCVDDESRQGSNPMILKVAGASETMPPQRKRQGRPRKTTQQNTKTRPTKPSTPIFAAISYRLENKEKPGGKKRFGCPHCDKVFASSGGLRYHMENNVCRKATEPKEAETNVERDSDCNIDLLDNNLTKKKGGKRKEKVDTFAGSSSNGPGKKRKRKSEGSVATPPSSSDKATAAYVPFTFPKLERGSKFRTSYGVVVEVIADNCLPPDYHKKKIVLDKGCNFAFIRRAKRFEEREKLVVDQIAAGTRHRREELKNMYLESRSTMGSSMTQNKVWSLYCKSLTPSQILTKWSTLGCKSDELERKTKIEKFDPAEDPRFPRNYYPDRIVECKLVEDRQKVFITPASCATDTDDAKEQFKLHPMANAQNHKTVPMRLYIARRELIQEHNSSMSRYICGDCGKFFQTLGRIKHHFYNGRCATTKADGKEAKKRRIKAIEKKVRLGSGHSLLQDFHGVKKLPSRFEPAPFGNPHRIKQHKKDKMPAWLVFNAQRSSMYPEIYASMEFKRGSQNRNHFIKAKEHEEYVPKAEKSRLQKRNWKKKRQIELRKSWTKNFAS